LCCPDKVNWFLNDTFLSEHIIDRNLTHSKVSVARVRNQRPVVTWVTRLGHPDSNVHIPTI
jgi:hypothetical protein